MNIKDIDIYLEKIKVKALLNVGVSHKVVSEISLEPCPDIKVGYKGFPCYKMAKDLRKSPVQIAEEVVSHIEKLVTDEDIILSATSVGPYVNFQLDPIEQSAIVLAQVFRQQTSFGHKPLDGSSKKMMVEFSSPNTNKPLHLGHVRNNVLGDSISNILRAGGNSITTTNLINDRGIHICQSMVAYQLFGKGETPESTGMKGDHFVGKYYVLFNDKKNETLIEKAHEMLRLWEEGDPEIRKLWNRMNNWVLEGFQETYRRQHIQFDTVYFESETYNLGKEIIEEGVKKGILDRREDGAIVLDLSKIDIQNNKENEKVLLRSDGTTVYMTQDIGTALCRFKDHEVTDILYVVGDKQKYHFEVLTRLMTLLNPEMKNKLHHISYGMVDLPEGKMGSRFGNVIKADDLLNELESLATEALDSRYNDLEEHKKEYRSQVIALAALKFHLLDYNPATTVTFNHEESLAFQGRTGPYCLYSYARINSILRQLDAAGITPDLAIEKISTNLGTDLEMEIIHLLHKWPEIVGRASTNKDPSAITSFLFRICKAFSSLYNDPDHQIVKISNIHRQQSLIALAIATKIAIGCGLDLLGIPTLEKM